MRNLKVCILALFAVFAVTAVTAATASALPEVHSKGGVTATGSATGASVAALSTALSAPITAGKVSLELSCAELTSLCPYTAVFTGSQLEGKTCSTAGAKEAGEIAVTKNEVHLVWPTTLTPLTIGGDFLVAKFTITCTKGEESLKVTVEGEAIGKIEGNGKELKSDEEITSFLGNLKCTKPNNGKQEVKEYFEDAGKLKKGILTANLGLGPETGCEEVTKPVEIKASKAANFLF
jgi:hypothetical protein